MFCLYLVGILTGISVLDHSVMYFYTQSQSAINHSNHTLLASFKYGTSNEEKEDIAQQWY